jgi:hypothetical protein
MAKQRRKGAAQRAVVAAQPSSTFKGVSFDKSTRRWRAQFRCPGDDKDTFLGVFGTQDEAARAYDRMMVWLQLHGHTMRGGFTFNFARDDYAGEEEDLRGRSQEAMVEKLREGAQRAVAATQTSTFTGVTFVKSTGRWRAFTSDGDGKDTHLGCYGTREEAARAYDRMMVWLQLHGHTRKGGFTFNFERGKYQSEEAELKSLSQEAMVEKLREDAQRAVVAATQTSKLTGVSRVKSTGRWRAKFRCAGDGRQTTLGYYDTREEAARAYTYDRMMA